MNPPSVRKTYTPKEWHDYNIAIGNSPVTNYPDVNEQFKAGKYLSFYNPKEYAKNESGGFYNIKKPNLTVSDPNYSPTIDYNKDYGVIKPSKPSVYVDPSRKSTVFSPYQNYNPNTNAYSDPSTGKAIAPMLEEQTPYQAYNRGGLVQKLDTGSYVYSQTKPGNYLEGNGVATINEGDAKRGFGSRVRSTLKDKKVQANLQSAGNLGMTATAGLNQPIDSPTSNPNVVANTEATKAGIDTVAGSLTPWYGLAKTASNLGRSALPKDQYGRVQGGGYQAADTMFKPKHEQMIDSYNREGVGGIAKEAFGAGSEIGALSDLFGQGKEKSGFWGALNDYSGNSARNRQEGDDDAARQKVIDDEANAKADAARQANIDAAMSQRTLENYKDGGKILKAPSYSDGGIIIGPGTGKSDSIPAKVKAGSFVVPSENADEAELLRKAILPAPKMNRAQLNQSNGEPVMVSNGEHLFTPKEVDKIKKAGINVNLLAPNGKPQFARK